jgi:8-oxo-dGTP pyrophosphatase MutT (NUDIX family)
LYGVVTTALVAEILVAGLEAVAWLSLFIVAAVGSSGIHWSRLASFGALLTLVILAAAYVLGVVIDRFSDTVVLAVYRLWRPRPVDMPNDIDHMRLTLLKEDDGVAKQLEYQRSRMRVARSTVLNLIILAPALGLFLSFRTNADSAILAGSLAAVLLTAGLTYIAFRLIDFTYVQRLSQAYRIHEDLPKPEIAAAVVYYWEEEEDLSTRASSRRDETNRPRTPKFCLVRTEDKQRWTFPKGHREAGETLPEAAVREAREEAGIKSPKVDPQRLICFRYPPTRPGKVHDDVVAAFLLEVKPPPPEPPSRAELGRDPKWFFARELTQQLSEGRREAKYLDELSQVVIAATDRLERRSRRRSALDRLRWTATHI